MTYKLQSNHILLCVLMCVAACTLFSCGQKTRSVSDIDGLSVDSDSVKSVVDTITVETQSASKKNKYARVHVTLTLPVGNDVAQTIRQSLLTLMGTQIYKDADYGGDSKVNGKPFSGDINNLKAVCNFYCENIFEPIEKENREEYQFNVQSMDNDTTMTEEQRKDFQNDFPAYEQEVTLSKVSEDDNYIVFNDMSYGDRGGAHGGVGGYGYIIFNRSTGKQVKSIIKPGVATKMQRLLKDGLKQYFKECGSGESDLTDKELMEELILPEGMNIIPLPEHNGIAPTKDGLTFVYSQYEIGPYALGMPAFTIPYDKVKVFMPAEALELIKQ